MKSLEDIAKEYLKVLRRHEKYPAFTVDEDFNVVKGVGCIKSNGSFNYHNNYDDSEDTLWFNQTKESYCEKEGWWTLSEVEANERRNELVKKKIKQLQRRIDSLKTKYFA